MSLRWLFAVLGVLCLIGVSTGCKDDDDGTTPIADAVLPPLGLTDDTPDILVTWIDDRGETFTGISVKEVPEASKSHVRVVTRTGGHGALFYVADLTKKNADGTYVVNTMPARDWEKLIQDRRDAYRDKFAPPPKAKASSSAKPGPATVPGVEAIVYGAVWCGPCHQAKKYLQKRGIKVHYYDIEKEPARGREMQRKLVAAGKRGGSIPVIDINGIILQGFSGRAVDVAIRRAQKATTL